MAKKLKETDRHTDIHTYRLPLVVLSAALQQKIIILERKESYGSGKCWKNLYAGRKRECRQSVVLNK